MYKKVDMDFIPLFELHIQNASAHLIYIMHICKF